jgi:hypothetical protein
MSQNDGLTRTLTRELEHRARAMDDSLLHLADVQGRARSIRRRRTASAVAGVAAAVALVVPTVLVATHTSGRPEPAPATQHPSPTPTTSPTTTPTSNSHPPRPDVLDISDLATGSEPHIDYVYDGRLHLPDGATPVRTRYDAQQFVQMDDGSRVWLTVHDATPYIEIQDTDGGFRDPVASGWGLSVNPAHTVSAWLTPQGRVTVWEAHATDPRPLGDLVPGSDLRLGPVSGEKCSLACSVIVNVPGPETWQPWEVSDAGSHQLRDGGYRVVDDISRSGLYVGRTRLSDSGSCSKLLGGGEFQGFETCKSQFSGFSPDGQLLLGEPAYYDGAGPSAIAMYDVTGKKLFERRATAAVQSYYAAPAVWEDNFHALAAVYQDGTWAWAVVRFATDGSMEYAVAPVKGPYERSPYVFPSHPFDNES